MGILFSCFKSHSYEKLNTNGQMDDDFDNNLGIPEDEEYMAAMAINEKDDDLQLSDQEINNYLEKLKESEL